MTENKRDLTADLAICNAATNGPWNVQIEEYVCNAGWWTEDHNIMPDIAKDVYETADATFIAEARTGWPIAIERALAAEEGCDRLARELEDVLERSMKRKYEIAELNVQIRIMSESLAYRSAELRREGDLRMELQMEVERLRDACGLLDAYRDDVVRLTEEKRAAEAGLEGLRAVRDALLAAHDRRGAILTAACGDTDAVKLAWKTVYPEYYTEKDGGVR